jgi:hypothetical protein
MLYDFITTMALLMWVAAFAVLGQHELQMIITRVLGGVAPMIQWFGIWLQMFAGRAGCHPAHGGHNGGIPFAGPDACLVRNVS